MTRSPKELPDNLTFSNIFPLNFTLTPDLAHSHALREWEEFLAKIQESSCEIPELCKSLECCSSNTLMEPGSKEDRRC